MEYPDYNSENNLKTQKGKNYKQADKFSKFQLAQNLYIPSNSMGINSGIHKSTIHLNAQKHRLRIYTSANQRSTYITIHLYTSEGKNRKLPPFDILQFC